MSDKGEIVKFGLAPKAMQRFSFSVLLKIFVMAITTASSLYAAGTPAGTVIKSEVVVTYTSDKGVRFTVSKEVQLVVKQVAAVNLTPGSLSTTAHLGNFTIFPLTLVNSGNGSDNFSFNAASSSGKEIAVFKDVDGSGSLTAGDTLAGRLTTSGALAEDSSMGIFVRVSIPDDEALNNQSDQTSLTATSNFDAAKKVVSLLNSTVRSPIIHLQNALSVNNPSPTVPGPVTYTLSFTNTGSDSATNVVVSQKLDQRFSFLSATAGGIRSGTDSVLWNLSSIAPGASVTVSVTVNLVQGILNGTIIPDSMNVTFGDGSLRRTKTSNSVTISVTSTSNQPNFDFSYSLPDSNVIAGDTVQIWLKFKNTGSVTADTLTIQNTISDSRLHLLNASGSGVVHGDTVTWRRFHFVPSSSGSVFFRVVIPSGFPAGTFLVSVGTLSWHDYSQTISQHLTVGSFARLEVSVVPSLSVVGSGRTIDYQIIVKNTGNSNALSGVLTDTLGTTGTVVQVSPFPHVVFDGGNAMRWNLGTLPSSSQRTFFLTARAFPNLGTSELRNIASLSASNITEPSIQETLTPIVSVRPATITLHASEQYIFGQVNQDSTKISASLSDSLGSPIPDGVPVVFTTTLGTFSNDTSSFTVFTMNGSASAFLHSADVANDVRTANVTVTAGVPQFGTASAGIDIIMYPNAITGFVKEITGNSVIPVVGAIVRVYSDYDTVHYVGIDTSDDQGLYFVALKHDFTAKYFIAKITALDNFGEPVTWSTIFTQGTQPKPAVKALSSIEGRLQYLGTNSPAPISGIPLFLDSLGLLSAQGSAGKGASTLTFNVQKSITDKNGRYLFENLQPAVYKIWVDSAKYPQYAGCDTIALSGHGIFTINANILVQVDSSAAMTMTVPDTVYADSTYMLLIHVANTGNVNHTNITVRDTLNAHFTFLGAAKSVFDSLSYDSSSHAVEWGSAVMLHKTDTTLWVRVGFVPNIPDGTVLTNRAWMKSDQLSSSLTSQRTMIVRSSPNITFGQFVEGGSDSVIAGYPVRLKLWFSNTGTDSLHNVIIRDTIFNAALSGISVQIDTSKYGVKDTATVHDSIITWNVHSIPSGMFDTLHILLRTDPRLPGGVAIKSNGYMLQNGAEIFSAKKTITTVSNSQLATYLVINKTGNKRTAEIGDVVTYQITITNNSPDSLYHLQIIDQLPYAFTYYKGSGHYNGIALEPVKQNRTLSWTISSSLAKGTPATLIYQLVLGADALESDGMNSAIAVATTIDGAPLYSASSQWQVAVKPGVFTDRGIIFGKIFYDDDRNAYQSDGEDGVKNVEIWMEDGTRITTGDNGKYSLPNVKPGEHVLRVNERTLPKGTELTLGKHSFAGDASSRFVTLTEGGIARANFYVKRTFQDSLTQSAAQTIRLAARKVETPKEILVRSGAGVAWQKNVAEYVLQFNYSGPAWIQRITVVDSLPAGFDYIKGSATFNGQSVEPIIDGEFLRWNLGRGVSPFEGELHYRVQVRYFKLEKIPARSYSYLEIMNADSLVTHLDKLWTTTYLQGSPYQETIFKIGLPMFEAGKISLQNDAFEAFDKICSIVRKYKKANFIVVGLPDSVEGNAQQIQGSLLAQKRAQVALDFLYRRLGKDSVRVTSAGLFDAGTGGNVPGTLVDEAAEENRAVSHVELIMRDYFVSELAPKLPIDSVEDFAITENIPELEKYYNDKLTVSPDDHIIFRTNLFSNPLAKNREVELLDTIPSGLMMQIKKMFLNGIPVYSLGRNSNVFISRISSLLKKGRNEISFEASVTPPFTTETLKNEIWLRRINNFNEATFEKSNEVKILVQKKRLPLFEKVERSLVSLKRANMSVLGSEIIKPPAAKEQRELLHHSVKRK